MIILAGLLLALVALYWWLIGHWFARVVMWFPIAALLCLIGGKAGAEAAPNSGGMLLTGFLLGIIAAWFVSGIPIYYHRWRFEKQHATALAMFPLD